MAASPVNAHLASVSGFFTWIGAHAPEALPHGNPAGRVKSLPRPPLEPRALSETQVRSLKNLLDRLDRFYRRSGRRQIAAARPARDRAIVQLLLPTGLRREELVNLDLTQVNPCEPGALRAAKRARITGVASGMCSCPRMRGPPWPATWTTNVLPTGGRARRRCF